MGGLFGDVARSIGIGGDDESLTNLGLSAIPGVGAYLGAQQANQANAQQSQAQMDFQERMSSTAHQREVKDLSAAGLNPILSAHSSGASSPGGAQANMQNTLAAGGLSNAVQAYQEYQTRQKDNELKAQQSEVAKATKLNIDTDTALKGKELPKASLSESLYRWYNKMVDRAQSNASNPNTITGKMMGQPIDLDKILGKQPKIRQGGLK